MNNDLIEKAKDFLKEGYTNIDGWITDGWPQRMAEFAEAYAAERVAAERERIACRLLREIIEKAVREGRLPEATKITGLPDGGREQ